MFWLHDDKTKFSVWVFGWHKQIDMFENPTTRFIQHKLTQCLIIFNEARLFPKRLSLRWRNTSHNDFTNLSLGAVFTVGPDAYTQFTAPVTYLGGAPMVFYSQSIDVTTPPAPQFGVSNVQSVTLTP